MAAALLCVLVLFACTSCAHMRRAPHGNDPMDSSAYEKSTMQYALKEDGSGNAMPEEEPEYLLISEGYVYVSGLYRPEKQGHSVTYYQHGQDGSFTGTKVTATMYQTGGAYITVSSPSGFEYFLTGNIILRETYERRESWMTKTQWQTD